MKLKKMLTSIIATAMLLSSMGLTAFAEDSAIVAKVGNAEYTDIQEAIREAAPDGTVEIVKDITVEEWKQFQQGDSSYQYLIYIDMNGLTINGNNHTLTVSNIISGSNGNRLFSSANNINILNLTINQPDGLGGISLKSGKIENVTFNSGNGIFPEDGDIAINKCTFKTDGYCIYSEEENNGLKVTNNTIDIDDGKNVIFLRGNTEFTGNEIVSGGKTRVVSGSPTVSDNSFGDAIVKVYNDATAKIENNSIINIEIDDETKPVSATFAGNELSAEAYEKLASIDEELVENNTIIVESPKGTITYGYVSQNEIWGELTTNAKTSVEIEIYAGETKIAKTTLNNIGGIIDGDVYVTWHNNFVGNFDEYWTTEWYNGNPVIDVVPTKVVLVADGIAVAENVVKMNGPDNLNPVKWEELEKVVAANLPSAEVKNLGAITVTPNYVYNGSLTQGKDPIDLQIAMEFVAKDTPEQAAKNPFGEYTTDFFIEISNLSSEGFDATGCYLAGHYGDWGWVQVPLDGMTVENGKIYPVITSVGFDFSYVDICTSVKDFKCGIYLTEKVLEENPNLEVKLTLGLSKDKESALTTDFITVDEATYVKADFGKKVCNWTIENDAGFYIDGETKYGMIRFLFAADVYGEIEEYGIKYSKADDITEDVTADGKTTSAIGNTDAFYGDLIDISENSNTTYYASAFVKVDGEYLWSEVANCSPNWKNNYTGYTGGTN